MYLRSNESISGAGQESADREGASAPTKDGQSIAPSRWSAAGPLPDGGALRATRVPGPRGGWVLRAWRAVPVLLIVAAAQNARADVLLSASDVVSTGAAPVQGSYVAQASGAVDLTLTDLGQLAQAAGQPFPSPLASLQLAVTDVTGLVATMPAASATPATFNVTSGTTYTIRVIGAPPANAAIPSGSFTATLTAHGSTAPVLFTLSGNFTTPPASGPQLTALFTQNFTVTSAGDHTVTLGDPAFPAALGSVAALVMQGSQVVGPQNPFGLGATVLPALATGTYQVYIVATAQAAPGAGLLGFQVTGPSAQLPSLTLPVGSISALGSFTSPTAQNVSATLTDYQAPAPLATLEAAVSLGAQLVAPLTAVGTSPPFAVPAGQLLSVWGVASAAPGSAGAYGLAAGPAAGAPLFNMQTGLPGAGLYPFVVVLPSAAIYSLTVNDLLFPTALPAIGFQAYQGGAPLGNAMTTSGVENVSAAAGSLVLVVKLTAPASGAGLFGAAIAPASGGPALLDVAQAVGASFTNTPVVVTTTENYDVKLNDLMWPASFSTLAAALTQGGQLIGSAPGAGSGFRFSATPGRYLATVIAIPSAGQFAGLYTLGAQSSAPTVSLMPSTATLQPGQGVQLSWTTTNAASCTASGGAAGAGGWLGAEPTADTKSVGPLNASATLTLTCTGPGGSAQASATITVDPVSGSSHGGGSFGGLELAVLAVFAMILPARIRRRLRAS
jgi:hypothetical protein